MMHRITVVPALLGLLVVCLLVVAEPARAVEREPAKKTSTGSSHAEPWKGDSPPQRFYLGGMAGAGVLDSRIGFSILGTAAVKIVNRGFISDVNDQVFLEAQAGPLFLPGLTALQYHLHLRWDFNKNEDWTFFALGGMGGIVGSGRAVFYPHFGVGVMWNLFVGMSLRAELSHEFLGAGAVILL